MESDCAPSYRVRLFLSVDLTGSTLFKSKNDSFTWLKAFQEFYRDFPDGFVKRYDQVCAEIPSLPKEHRERPPRVWKTIGDEILFVNRVESIIHLGAYVRAFSETLQEFGQSVADQNGLNTKGNGWVAAFPTPNCSIKVHTPGSGDPIAGQNELITEDFEADVDKNPEKYDFLGKGIDSGFRISKNSTIETFTISPALAYLLVKAKSNPDASKFDCSFVFHEPQQFKGVVDNRPYPVISIETVRSRDERELKEIEARLLNRPGLVGKIDDLRDYLERYIRMRGIEMPSLKLSSADKEEALPAHYDTYVSQWNSEKVKAETDLASLSEDLAAEDDFEELSSDEAAGDLKLSG